MLGPKQEVSMVLGTKGQKQEWLHLITISSKSLEDFLFSVCTALGSPRL